MVFNILKELNMIPFNEELLLFLTNVKLERLY